MNVVALGGAPGISHISVTWGLGASGQTPPTPPPKKKSGNRDEAERYWRLQWAQIALELTAARVAVDAPVPGQEGPPAAAALPPMPPEALVPQMQAQAPITALVQITVTVDGVKHVFRDIISIGPKDPGKLA